MKKFWPPLRMSRLWRSLKYEEVYLKANDTIAQANDGFRGWMIFATHRRKPQALDRQTANTVYNVQTMGPTSLETVHAGDASQ